jgi:hypothetical protein
LSLCNKNAALWIAQFIYSAQTLHMRKKKA